VTSVKVVTHLRCKKDTGKPRDYKEDCQGKDGIAAFGHNI